MVAIPLLIENTIWKWILLGIVWVLLLALMIYQMYLTTIGLAKLQNISKLKAFICIYVLGTISYFIFVIIASVVIGVVFAFIVQALGLYP